MLHNGHDLNYVSFQFYDFPSVSSFVFVNSEAKFSFKCSALAISKDMKTTGPYETASLMNESAVKASKLQLQ